jgi:hypothetical protein
MGINLSLEFVSMGIWLVEYWKMGEMMMSHFEFHFDFTPPMIVSYVQWNLTCLSQLLFR